MYIYIYVLGGLGDREVKGGRDLSLYGQLHW